MASIVISGTKVTFKDDSNAETSKFTVDEANKHFTDSGTYDYLVLNSQSSCNTSYTANENFISTSTKFSGGLPYSAAGQTKISSGVFVPGCSGCASQDGKVCWKCISCVSCNSCNVCQSCYSYKHGCQKCTSCQECNGSCYGSTYANI